MPVRFAITDNRSSLQFQAIYDSENFQHMALTNCLLLCMSCGLLSGPLSLHQSLFWLVLSNFFFLNPFSKMAHNGTARNPTQYDPRWQAI